MYIIIIFFLMTIKTSSEVHLAYSHESIRHSGEECLTNCVNEECFINRQLDKDNCTGSGPSSGELQKTREYYSFLHRNIINQKCISNCGKFGEEYEWCFVEYDATYNLSWDYCSRQKLTYTSASYSLDGYPCFNDCVNNQCAVGWVIDNATQTFIVKQCKPSNESAFVYYTFSYGIHTTLHHEQSETTCLTRCGKFGYPYEWCFTDVFYNWGYCCSLDLTFAVGSYTTDGLLCLNDCVDNKCASDSSLQIKECIRGNLTAPVYFTKQNRKDYSVCLSRCDKYNRDSDWCFVNFQYGWDYCYSINATFTKMYSGTNGSPCMNDCVLNKCIADKKLTMMECESNSDVAPAPKYYTYRVRYTTAITTCVSRCAKAGEDYDWCFVNTKGKAWDYCNSVSINYTVQANTLDGQPCLNNCYEGKCAVSFSLHMEDCMSTNDTTPVYYTKMERFDEIKTCMSNCDKFGTNQEWCFVTEDLQWDWCLPINLKPRRRLRLKNELKLFENLLC